MKNTFVLFLSVFTVFAISPLVKAEEEFSEKIVNVDVSTWISLGGPITGTSEQLTLYHLDPITILNSSSNSVRFQTILIICKRKNHIGTGLEIYRKAGEDNLTATVAIPPHKLFQNEAEVITLDKHVSLETKGFVTCPGETDNVVDFSLFMGHEPIFAATAVIPTKEAIPIHKKRKEGLRVKFQSKW